MRTRAHLIALSCLVLGAVAIGVAVAGCGSSTEAHAMETQARTFVVPHVLDTEGRVEDAAQFTRPVHDTTVFASYVAGIPGVTNASASSATVTVHLFDEGAGDLAGMGGAPVATQTFQLDATRRKVRIDCEDMLAAEGVFDGNPVFLGFAVITIAGDDAEAVAIQTFTTSAHDSAFDLSVVGCAPQEIVTTVE